MFCEVMQDLSGNKLTALLPLDDVSLFPHDRYVMLENTGFVCYNDNECRPVCKQGCLLLKYLEE